MLTSPQNNRKSDDFFKVINVFNFNPFNLKNLSFLNVIAFLSLFIYNTGYTQVSNYTFSESTSTYTAITGASIVFNNGWDNNTTPNNIAIGFTFNYNGTNYTTCSVNTNGFITFGTTLSNSTEYNPISSSTAYSGAISALGVDLKSNGSAITYKTIGSAPNRVFVVQWTNAERDAEDGDFNFQIRLNETSNTVNISYGSCQPSDNSVVYVQVGLRGSSNSDFNNRSQPSNGKWMGNTNAGTNNNDANRTRSGNSNGSYPNTNLLYTWTPSSTPPGVCIPSSSSNTFYISSYKTTGAVVDAPTNTTGYSTSGYGDYTALTPAQQIPGGGINVSLVLSGGLQTARVWVDWNKNNTFEDASEIVFTTNTSFNSNTFGFVVPTGTAPGDYRMRIRTKSTAACGSNSDGETEDYTIRVIQDCPAKITSAPTVELCGTGTVTLTVTGTSGVTSYKWYTTESGGTAIAGATSASYTTPSLSATTTYYVTALNGSCESLVRTPIIAKIKPVPNITITPASPQICGEEDLVQISAAGSTEVVDLLNETFEASGFGAFTKVNIANGDALTEWQQKTSVYTTVSGVWKPAISSGAIGNKFAFTTSDYSSSSTKNLALQTTNSYNTTNFIDLTLTYRQYFSCYGNGDNAIVEVSTNNGTSWTAVQTYTSSQGSPGKFTTVTIPLNSYVGVANLKLRFRYVAVYSDGWAIDDVVLSGTRPLTSNFTWTGATIDAYTDAAGTVPYTNQAVNVVYIKPSTAQLEVNNWSFTANVQLTNGCTASKLVNVTNKSKVWQGNNGNWNDPNNWLPVGVPAADNCVIIKPATNYANVNGTNYVGLAKTLTVRTNARLEVPTGNGVNVVNKITVQNNGTFNLANSASIIQTDNVANSGIVNIKRTTQPMYRYDFTYWNSPVTLASNFTLSALSPNTLSDKYYRWQPTINGGYGNWIGVNATTTAMDPRMGYIVRAPQSFDLNPANKTTYTATFVGTPNNGDITIPIAIGTDANIGNGVTADDDQWNLIGNPYASAIDVVSFLNETTNKTLLDGTVYVWTHNTPIQTGTANPFYGNYSYNYTSSDYATVNKFGATATAISGGTQPSRYIASGQSFFVKGIANGNAKFINSMRVSGSNNTFLKSGAAQINPETQAVNSGELEKHRIWLNLANANGAFSQILVGYAEGASLDFDRGLDGQAFGGNGVTFYSTIPEMNLTIQARPLPFNEDDKVALGFNANAQDTYQIGIDHLDGVFDTHAIFLEDKTLNVIHDLRTAPYSFTSAAGTFNDRFVLRFSNGNLGNVDFTNENGIKILRGNELAVHSSSERIKNIVAFDVLGRKIDEYKNADENEITLKNVKKSTSVVLLKITLENGAVVDRKTIF